MARKILGSGGGGGGGSTFVTKPDTLRSDDNFEILLGLGSGRWKGLVNGLQSLKLNGVSLENSDGTSNFEDVFMIFADGNPLEDQIVSFQLGGGGNTQTINTQLVNTTGTGTWVSGSVSTPNANYIDIRFLVNQLFYQDEKSIRENTANIEIEMRPSGSSEWTNIFSGTNTSGTVYDPDGYDFYDQNGAPLSVYLSRSMFNANGVGFQGTSTNTLDITGKTTSPYIKELRVAVPNTGDYANKTWEVRVRLNNKDAVDTDEIQQRRTIVLETLAAVITDNLGDDPEWDGLVWAQIHGKASDQFNGFPEITGIFDTKICQVPPSAVFDPDARTYTNVTWDGSFEEAFTTDPAWQIKEFVEDPIHGIAGIYPGATLDKWDALEASKYFSEQVSDGRGGTHPRFSMNLTITEAKEIDEMMQYLAGAVNSYTEDIGGGTWRFKVDKPEDPVMLFTEDNVFTEFQYSHSDIDTRFNDWRGTFLDESLDYETNTVRVFDQDDIDLNGIKFTEVALIGCTHPQEALRRLMFRLRVSLNEFRSVSFETNRIGRLINPLDTILVADGSLNPNHLVKSTSRLDSYNGTTVTLKRPLRLETGVAYTIKFSTTDGVVERTVQNDSNSRGDVTSIEIDSALPAEVMADSAVALEATGLAALPVTYRVLSVDRDEDDEDRYTISAVQVDSGKWDAMDNVSQADIYAQESDLTVDSPTVPNTGMFSLVTYRSEARTNSTLQVNWDRPSGQFLSSYEVQYRVNDGPWRLFSNDLKDSLAEIQNPSPGTYDFKIFALDRRGLRSNPLVARYTLEDDVSQAPVVHIRGLLLDRPEEAHHGLRYTSTDTSPIRTDVWTSNLGWVSESSFIGSAEDIGVESGATRTLPGQLLKNEDFDPEWWDHDYGYPYSEPKAPNGIALEIPGQPLEENFTTYAGSLDKYLETTPGSRLYLRFVTARNIGQRSELTDEGKSLMDNGQTVVDYTHTAPNWPLQIKVSWYDQFADLISVEDLEDVEVNVEGTINRNIASPDDAYFARISFGHDDTVNSSGSWVIWRLWVAEHQPAADKTASNVPRHELPSNPNIVLKSDGTVASDQLPRSVSLKRLRGNEDVTLFSDWSLTADNLTATINNDPVSDQRGRITITDIEGTTGKLIISSTRDGVTLSDILVVTTSQLPKDGDAGSAGSGVTSTTQSISETISTNTLTSVMAAVVDSSGDLTGTAQFLEYYPLSSQVRLLGKFSYSPQGADTWVEFGSEVGGGLARQSSNGGGNQERERLEYEEPIQGYITINQSVSGLTPGEYDVKLELRTESSNQSAALSGSATVES